VAHTTGTDEELWERALDCFDARDWWMAHELLEQLWKRHAGTDDARLYQGLLQAAVCFYHYGNGNFSGARILAHSAIDLLGPLPPDAHGLNLAEFREAFALKVNPLLTPDAKLQPIDPKQTTPLSRSPKR
jgi:predicted metal-dependent hydrolase